MTYAQSNFPSLEKILNIASTYHPVLKQEQINIEITQADILKAKSKFVPEYMQRAVVDQKYSYLSNEISWNTPLGIELIAGLRTGAGDSSLPKDSLTYSHISSSFDSIKKTSISSYNEDEIKLGFRMPLLNGLITDKNRTNIKLSKIQPSIANLQLQDKRNNLFRKIALEYSDVYFALREYNIYQDLLENLTEQESFTKKLINAGSLADIDLIELNSQQQQYKIKSIDSENKFNKAKLKLFINIWSLDFDPNELINIKSKPINYQIQKIQNNLNKKDKLSLISRLPQYKMFAYKYKQQKIKKRLAQNNLLPKVDLEMLAVQDLEYFNDTQTSLLGSINMKLPLLQLESRADLNKVNLYTQQLLEKQKLLKQKLLNNINIAEFSLENSLSKIELMSDNIQLLEQLLSSERKKLNVGLGDMLKVNIRLSKLINSQLELNKLLQENYNSWIEYNFTIGHYIK